MGGGQGPTKPRADRGYHFDVSVWGCGWISIGPILNKDKYESECAVGILFFRGDVASKISSFNDMSKQK